MVNESLSSRQLNVKVPKSAAGLLPQSHIRRRDCLLLPMAEPDHSKQSHCFFLVHIESEGEIGN